MEALPLEMRRRLETQFGIVSRSQALAGGLSTNDVEALVRGGRFETVHAGVYRLSGSPVTPESVILAACLAAGPRAVASHRSAAFLWGLVDDGGPTPVVSVPFPTHPRVAGVCVHRASDLDPSRTVLWKGIPCTDPLRTLVDLAASCDAALLDAAIDRGLAKKLVTVEGLLAELGRLGRPGRSGAGRLRGALASRRYIGAPAPSVLESRALRLLRRHGIRPIASELKVDGGRFRLDIAVSDAVAVEVDGYLYHSTPEAMARDLQRRNHLRLQGRWVLVYTWADVTNDERRVVREVRAALHLAANGSPASLA